MRVCIKLCILPVAPLLSSLGYQKSIKLVPPSGPLSLARVQSHMGWPRSLLGYSNHIQSTRDFVKRVKGVTLLPGGCFCSYDVSALFTLVPIDPALHIIKDLLEKDDTLWDRSILSVQNIIELLGFCLHNTYFSFQNKFYEQVEGTAMGSPVSPIVENLYMEHFERGALQSASTP